MTEYIQNIKTVSLADIKKRGINQRPAVTELQVYAESDSLAISGCHKGMHWSVSSCGLVTFLI